MGEFDTTYITTYLRGEKYRSKIENDENNEAMASQKGF